MATGTVIDSLLITLGIDNDGVKSGMAQAERSISNSVKSIINNVLAPLGTALALTSAFKSYLTNATSLSALSKIINENEEDIGAWSEAVSRSGGSVDGLQSTLTSLNSKMLEFSTTGTSSALPVLSQLGINARKSNGEVKSSIDILQDLAKSADRINPKRFQGLVSQLGIDSGTLLLLKQGSIAVEDLVKKQRDLGLYTKQDADTAFKMSNVYKDLMQVLRSFSTIIMREILPPLSWMTEKTISFVRFIKEHDTFLKATITGLAVAITTVLLPAIARVGKVMLKNPIVLMFLAIMAVVLGVAAVIEDLYVYMKGGSSALSSFWSLFGSGADVAKKLQSTLNGLKNDISYITGFLKRFATVSVDSFKTFLSIIKEMSSYVWNFIKLIAGLVTLDLDIINKAFDGLKESASNLYNHIKDLFVNGFSFITDEISNLYNYITASIDAMLKFFNLKDKVSDFVNNGVGTLKSWLNIDTNINDTLPSSIINNKGGNSINSQSQVNVGNVTINTSATDAAGIAKELPTAVINQMSRFGVMSNGGVVLK